MKSIIVVVICLCITLGEGRREVSQEEAEVIQKLKSLQDPECGMFSHGPDLPWMVSVTRRHDAKRLCDGVLIYPDVLLTSAHCVENHLDQELLITAIGVPDYIRRGSLDDFERVVTEIHINPSYRACSRRNNLAILILSKPYRLNYIKIACLPHFNESYYVGYCVKKLMEYQEPVEGEWSNNHCGDRVFEAPDPSQPMDEASCVQGNESTALIKKTQSYVLMCKSDQTDRFYYLGSKVRVEMCGPGEKGYWFYDTLYKYMPWIYQILRNRIIDYDLNENVFGLNSFN